MSKETSTSKSTHLLVLTAGDWGIAIGRSGTNLTACFDLARVDPDKWILEVILHLEVLADCELAADGMIAADGEPALRICPWSDSKEAPYPGTPVRVMGDTARQLSEQDEIDLAQAGRSTRDENNWVDPWLVEAFGSESAALQKRGDRDNGADK